MSRSLRIAYVCADLGVPVFGRKGASVHVQEVIRALLKLGVRVELFAARQGGAPPPDLASVRVHKLPRPPKGDLATRERAALAANGLLRAALEDAGPFAAVYERYSLWSHTGVGYAAAAGIPALLEVNAPLIEEQAEHRGLLDRAGAERVARSVFAGASAVMAVSRPLAGHLGQLYPELDGRLHVVPNGVDADRYARLSQTADEAIPGAPAEWRAGSFTVGFVGTLKPWHGLEYLVSAFERLYAANPSARLLLVGDGPERESLERGLQERGVRPAAHFTGAVGPEEIPGLLGAMDAAVAPYPPSAGFYFSPLKVYEYMAAGRAVVASRIGQLEDVIRDGHSGLLCEPGDATGLSAALDRLRRSPELRRRLGERARRAAVQDHTWDAVARRALGLAGFEADSGELASRKEEVRG